MFVSCGRSWTFKVYEDGGGWVHAADAETIVSNAAKHTFKHTLLRIVSPLVVADQIWPAILLTLSLKKSVGKIPAVAKSISVLHLPPD